MTPGSHVPGHSSTVNCMISVGDEHIITGSGDGAIRYIRILPTTERKLVRMLASHREAYSVARVDIGIETIQVRIHTHTHTHVRTHAAHTHTMMICYWLLLPFDVWLFH
eukprot:NODE_2352_length_940_cov_8.014590_g1933_i0.p2 GENE.NODE_2352_length_940_cov_8.014590_g1933_i0~~NODE_2352_length_940_cov_8.014590_g1933_i0.p2  ORF type:complete len:109 (-),score=23.43 NODE_2352_length_940_cov_8.014590_g1933_i0:496-822(-)